LQQLADGLGKGDLNRKVQVVLAAREFTWAGWVSCLLTFSEIQGGWFKVWRVAAQHSERELKQTTTHVELLEEGLWTRVQFPPAPPISCMLVVASSCGFMRVPKALISPRKDEFFGVSLATRTKHKTQRKNFNKKNGLLADFGLQPRVLKIF